MANADPTNEDLNNYDFDSHSSTYYPSQSWNMTAIDQMENMQHNTAPRRHVSPIQTSMANMRQNTMVEHAMMDDWHFQQLQQLQQQQQQHLLQQQQQQAAQQQQQQHQLQQQEQQHQHHAHQHVDFDHNQNALDLSYNTYNMSTPPNQMALVPVTQAAITTNLTTMDQFLQLQSNMPSTLHNWADLNHELVHYTTQDVGGVPVSPYHAPTGSPTGSHLEVISHTGTNDDTSWIVVEPGNLSFDSHERPHFVDPTHTLHDRSVSESSLSDFEQSNHQAFMAAMELTSTQAVYSPTNLSDSECEYSHAYHVHNSSMDHCPTTIRTLSQNSYVRPIAIPPSSSKGSSPVRSPGSQGSAGSPGRKPATKKSPIAAKSTDRVQKKTSTNSKLDSNEKRVGRRKGPLSMEQRKQASEIRKMRACLRCKFLKKTCDTGEPCAGCQPSHARLWQVPCTRIDIKDIGYFMKDKRFDYERHFTFGNSVGNILGFSEDEETLWITHGYGHALPVAAREVYVRDDSCLKVDWMENGGAPEGYEIATAKLSAGAAGVSASLLSDYLDRHINDHESFEKFVDGYFEGTPFLSQMLKVASKFHSRTKSPIIKKALKLMLAYSLTVHITMVEGTPSEKHFVGKIEESTSKFYGKTMAPVMINFQVKIAMADMWRELHKDVLEELSSLYSSVYSGDKLKNWPTIFILASVLLAVWECMQFDCFYRVPDEAAVDKFCSDMETTPVGVVVGLFSAISQKLPSILEWDTSKHHALLGSNRDVCDTMTEVRQHVADHETYLRGRPNAKFQRGNFDSLSNKFLSRLVLRDIRTN